MCELNTESYLFKHFLFFMRNMYDLVETIKIMSVILKQAYLAQEESVDCMVYQALRAYQDHQVSKTFILHTDRHCIGLAASFVCEIFAMGLSFFVL